jgi:hypothetical protein
LRAARVSTYRSLARARALALSRLGRATEAVELLGELAREHPRDEEILAELLRCEAATVGAAATLVRYDGYRRALRDELGSDPGLALQAVHRELLVPAVRRGVRREPNPLLGRDKDLVAVADLLRASRVTSIVGAGGLGKTRLAHAVARQAEKRIVQFVELAGVAADSDVVAEVASALGGQPAGIVDALGPGPALLVLDNCEHVVRGAAALVQTLVSASPDLRVLTTSRAPLGLSSESVYPLPELDQLVDQSLLKAADTASGTRFRMLETVREFATARRTEAGENDRVIDRLLDWARDFGAQLPETDGLPAIGTIRAEQDNLLQALRHGHDRQDGTTVAATAALLGGLWVTESNFTRLATLAADTAWILSHLRPEPALVEATRTASVLGAMTGFLMPGLSPLRALVTLRRLPLAPPDTLIRAAHIVLCAPDLHAALGAVPDGRARHRCDGHRLPSGHLGRLLRLPAGPAAGVPAASADPADLSPRVWTDLHRRGQLGPVRRRRAARAHLPVLGAARYRLRSRGHRDVPDHYWAVPDRGPNSVALGNLAARPGRRGLRRPGTDVFRR